MSDAATPDLPPGGAASRFEVVLVEPGESLNVGSVARAVSNFGAAALRLVAPRGYDRARAEITACHGAFVLDALTVHDDLSSALAGAEDVVGFSVRERDRRGLTRTFPEWLGGTAAPSRFSRAPRTALVFGPEDTGLRSEHVEFCRSLVRIPTSAANPSMNLSHAVAVALYEVSRLDEVRGTPGAEPPADWAQYDALDLIVQGVLSRVGFYRKGTPAQVPGLVRHLFRRIDPDRREMQVMLGVFGRIAKTLDGRLPLRSDPPPARGPARGRRGG